MNGRRNGRNNNIAYTMESRYLVRLNTVDCWIVFPNSPVTARQVLISTDIFKTKKQAMNETTKPICGWEKVTYKI